MVVTWIRIDVQYNQTHQTVKILHIAFTCTTHTVNHKLHATGQEMKAIQKIGLMQHLEVGSLHFHS